MASPNLFNGAEKLHGETGSERMGDVTSGFEDEVTHRRLTRRVLFKMDTR